MIRREQVLVRTFAKGFDGTELLSTYQNRSNDKYKSALGDRDTIQKTTIECTPNMV